VATATRIETGARPAAAVELTAEGVLAAARPGKGDAPVYAFAPLHGGALTPGSHETNLRAMEQVTTAIGAALGDVAQHGGSVTLVLPDACVRVFVLDFDSLPPKAADVVPVLKFRLRKMVPFDVEHAGVSFQVLTETKTECRALIAVTPGPILAEYEAAVRATGYEPGAVLPSSLAALAALETDEAALIACLSAGALTTAITHGQDLLLYRTLEPPADAAARQGEVQRDIAVAAAYFEDKIGARPTRLYYAGPNTAAEFARWLNDATLEVVELAARPTTGAATTLGKLSFAGMAGALAGAA
jgi:type IV pilus assembly protein PilM